MNELSYTQYIAQRCEVKANGIREEPTAEFPNIKEPPGKQIER